ncbi:MAG: rod-binding protein [Alphaproteobacteria bacterium]|nr:rod-binding protein [Alphaproteobacteria bacterium]
MAELGLSLPLDAMLARKPALPANPAEVRTREQAEKVAEDFERMFIAEMLQPMFAGVETDGPFGGGPAEDAFRPMLIDRYAQTVSSGGGVGIAKVVLREILRMQGLEE